MKSNRHIEVRAGLERYPVVFSGFRQELKRQLRDATRVAVVSNPTVFALHGRGLAEDLLPGACPAMPVMIGDGEQYKTQRTVSLLYEQFFDIGLERHDAIIAFGGGVVGDVAGFAAATYKRGITLILIPTTLLAMVDSSIGGKTAVNHVRGKNLIGAFYQPRAVIISTEWLGTLAQREILCGIAEIFKAGFLSSKRLVGEMATMDLDYTDGNKKRILSLIESAVKFKASVVARDVGDFGFRNILNFGHTYAHAIEKAEGYRNYRHGEAVLAGMAGALYLSHAVKRLSKGNMNEYLSYLTAFIERLRPLKKNASDYLSYMNVDKKNRRGRQVFVLLEKIGRPVVRIVRSHAAIKESIEFMQTFVNNRGKM